jgi:hypothetical protein
MALSHNVRAQAMEFRCGSSTVVQIHRLHISVHAIVVYIVSAECVAFFEDGHAACAVAPACHGANTNSAYLDNTESN